MRRAVTPAIPPSMYRHFAILTLALTMGLAMFAEGENRQVRAAPVVQAATPPAPVALATPAPRQAAGWANVEGDFDSGFGSPMERPHGGGESLGFGEIAVPGHSPEYLASLSDGERELLLGGLRENRIIDPDIRESRGAALAAASARRSGSAAASD